MENLALETILAKLVAANQMVTRSAGMGELVEKSWRDERDQIASVITRRFPEIDQEQILASTVGGDI